MSARVWRIASFMIVTGALAGLTGCRSVAALKQRCLSGDGASCDAACSKGVLGEGGCFHAAEEHRRRAAGDSSSTEGRRATELYEKACTGGYADGCLYAAQGLEAPYANVEAKSDKPPNLIPDDVLTRREQKLDRACSLGASAGCKRLGDATIGKSVERAKAAYHKACQASADATGCEAARIRESDIAERLRAECLRHVADSCTSLGDLLFAVDPPRAARVFAAECELRGVAELTGGVLAFVKARERDAEKGIPLAPEKREPVVIPPGAPKVTARAEVVRGRVAVVEVDRALSQHVDEFTACVEHAAPKVPLVVEAELVVDRTGDVFRATVPEGIVDPKTASCLAGVLETLSFTEPVGDLPQVRASLTILPAAPSAPAQEPRR